MRLLHIAHHRNGVCGVPFYVCLFKDGKDTMLGVQFDNAEGDKDIYTAVFNVEKLTAGDIAFASNSYRGDHFHEQIETWAGLYEGWRDILRNRENPGSVHSLAGTDDGQRPPKCFTDPKVTQ